MERFSYKGRRGWRRHMCPYAGRCNISVYFTQCFVSLVHAKGLLDATY